MANRRVISHSPVEEHPDSPIREHLEKVRQSNDIEKVRLVEDCIRMVDYPIRVPLFFNSNNLSDNDYLTLETLITPYEGEYLRKVQESEDSMGVYLHIADAVIGVYGMRSFKDGHELSAEQFSTLPKRLVSFQGVDNGMCGLELIFSKGNTIFNVLPEQISLQFIDQVPPPDAIESALYNIANSCTSAEQYIKQTAQRIKGFFNSANGV